MKTIFAIATTLLVVSHFFAGCSTAEDVQNDAKKTPIGSVITGETKSTSSYLKRVEKENKSLDRDTWRPQSSDRF